MATPLRPPSMPCPVSRSRPPGCTIGVETPVSRGVPPRSKRRKQPWLVPPTCQQSACLHKGRDRDRPRGRLRLWLLLRLRRLLRLLLRPAAEPTAEPEPVPEPVPEPELEPEGWRRACRP
eukprot:scaffold85104_cov60-Phaeocystis_antarctica.AAC.1